MTCNYKPLQYESSELKKSYKLQFLSDLRREKNLWWIALESREVGIKHGTKQGRAGQKYKRKGISRKSE